jgi:hypothetical protein
MASPTATLLTATSDSVVAVLHQSSIGHSRLSIPLYSSLDGVLQSTLTCSLPSNDVTVQKLVFASSEYLCALLSSDSVVIWSITRGVVAHTIKLSAFDLAPSSLDSLFVLTSKKNKLYLYEYTLESAKVIRKIKCGITTESNAWLAVSESFAAVSHDNKVKILSLEDGSKVAKLKVDKSASIMSMDGPRLAILTETGVVLYSIESGSPEEPVGQVFSQQPIHSLQIKDSIMLVTTETSTSLYKFPPSPTKDPLKPISIISSSPDVETLRISFSLSKAVLVAVLHSSSKGIHIQRVSHLDKDDSTVLEEVLVGYPAEQDEEKDTPDASTKRTEPASTTTTLGPGQAGGEALQASDRPTKKAKTTPATEDISIAERLQQLAQEMDRDDEDEELAKKPSESSFSSKKATTESLVNILSQALSSGDDAMLELSLGVRDKRVIALSLKELDANLVSLLLTKVTSRLSHRPNRASELCVWISLILESGKIHETQQLRPLRNLLQERVESFPHLLQLEGRLSMLAAMK